MAGFTIIKKNSPVTTSPGKSVNITTRRKTEDGLKKMAFDGDLIPGPLPFPDDVAQMKGWLKGKGFDVSTKDCQALWVTLSIAHNPYEQGLSSSWLIPSIMYRIADDHAVDHLVPA